MVLTKRQKEILDFITRFLDEKGYSPSLTEIGAHFGLSSVATVHKHVDNLRRKGLVRKVWNANRSLDLTPAAATVRAIRLPLAGRVAAGQPIEAVESREVIAVPADMVGRDECFVLQVSGDSMIDEQVRDGDFVVLQKRGRVQNGEIVVALIEGQEATLKKYFKDGETVRLEPANRTMKPLVIPAAKVIIQGVVVGLLRRYH